MQTLTNKKQPIIIDTKGRGIRALKGQTLTGRYLVGKSIDKGSYGKIFDCEDLVTGDQLVIKFSEDYKILAKEIQTLKKFLKILECKFSKTKHKYICQLIDYGMLVLYNFSPDQDKNDQNNNKVAGYFIMPKYFQNLEQYITNQQKIDPVTVLKITHQLMDAYDIVHACGRTFNDLKPQNIMVEHDKNGELYIVLIDFGFSAKFLTAEGCHISGLDLKDSFQGNILFSSVDQMEFKHTSRKDDMISICYLLLYMLNDLNIPGFDNHSKAMAQADTIEVFKIVKQYKQDISLQQMSQFIKLEVNLKENKHNVTIKKLKAQFQDSLGALAYQIQSLTFQQKPQYDIMQSHITSCIRTLEQINKMENNQDLNENQQQIKEQSETDYSSNLTNVRSAQQIQSITMSKGSNGQDEMEIPHQPKAKQPLGSLRNLIPTVGILTSPKSNDRSKVQSSGTPHRQINPFSWKK